MEKRKILLACVLALSTLAAAADAAAQTIVDGSGSELPPELLRAAIAEVTADLSDPLSAQIRGLRHPISGKSTEVFRKDTVCGFVNAKNDFGGYIGFKPFMYNGKNNLLSVFDPVKDGGNELIRTAFSEVGCSLR